MSEPNVIERAFQMARSGNFDPNAAIMKALKTEGFERVGLHFNSGSLRRQLIQEITNVREGGHLGIVTGAD